MFSVTNNKMLYFTFLKSELLKKNWLRVQKSTEEACLPTITACFWTIIVRTENGSEAENVKEGVADETRL